MPDLENGDLCGLEFEGLGNTGPQNKKRTNQDFQPTTDHYDECVNSPRSGIALVLYHGHITFCDACADILPGMGSNCMPGLLIEIDVVLPLHN